MKIDFGDPIEFEIPLANFPISEVSIRLMANRATIKVFVLQTAHDQMVEHVNRDKNIECGGVLVGYPFQDEESQETFVVIVGIIPDISSNRSIMHFTVTPDTISKTREILEEGFPELIAVGWYHSHPGHGIFLSGQDMTIVRGIYSESWNLAWVIDPIRNLEGIFWGADGEPLVEKSISQPLHQKNTVWIPLNEYPTCIRELQNEAIAKKDIVPLPARRGTNPETKPRDTPVIPSRKAASRLSKITCAQAAMIILFGGGLLLAAVLGITLFFDFTGILRVFPTPTALNAPPYTVTESPSATSTNSPTLTMEPTTIPTSTPEIITNDNLPPTSSGLIPGDISPTLVIPSPTTPSPSP